MSRKTVRPALAVGEAPADPEAQAAQRDAQELMDSVILAAAERPIRAGGGGRGPTTTVEAVVASLAAKAQAGDLRAQREFLQLYLAAKARKLETEKKIQSEEMRAWWDRACAAGDVGDGPLPLVEDVQFNRVKRQVVINGPRNENDQALWARQHAWREEMVATVADAREMLADMGGEPHPYWVDRFAHFESQIARIDAYYPSEAVRRRPGFDLNLAREEYERAEAAKRDGGDADCEPATQREAADGPAVPED
jgi:hypothetical protein